MAIGGEHTKIIDCARPSLIFLDGRMEFGASLVDRSVGVRLATPSDAEFACSLLAHDIRSGSFHWSHPEFSPNSIGPQGGDLTGACAKLLVVTTNGVPIGVVAGSQIVERRWALHWWGSLDSNDSSLLQATAAYLDDVDCVGTLSTSVLSSRHSDLELLLTLGLRVFDVVAD